MKYIYPNTTYKPVDGPETFNFLKGYSDSEAFDLLFMSEFDRKFRVVIRIMDGNIIDLPSYEKNDYDPYRIMVSTIKGLNKNQVEDNIILEILGIY